MIYSLVLVVSMMTPNGEVPVRSHVTQQYATSAACMVDAHKIANASVKVSSGFSTNGYCLGADSMEAAKALSELSALKGASL